MKRLSTVLMLLAMMLTFQGVSSASFSNVVTINEERYSYLEWNWSLDQGDGIDEQLNLGEHAANPPVIFQDLSFVYDTDSSGQIFISGYNFNWVASGECRVGCTYALFHIDAWQSSQVYTTGSFEKNYTRYEWAIYNPTESTPSHMSATFLPEPISSTLFIVGGATLGLRRFMRRKLA